MDKIIEVFLFEKINLLQVQVVITVLGEDIDKN